MLPAAGLRPTSTLSSGSSGRGGVPGEGSSLSCHDRAQGTPQPLPVLHSCRPGLSCSFLGQGLCSEQLAPGQLERQVGITMGGLLGRGAGGALCTPGSRL